MTTLEILDRLVAFDTVSCNSNLDLIAYVDHVLSSHGGRVKQIPSPCGTKAGIYAEIGPQVAGGVVLSGHTDVVPVDGQNWTKPAFKLTSQGDKLFGRGTTDMKGFVASALALALKASERDLQRPLAIVLSYDEEIGCVGLQHMASQLAPLIRAPKLCIVGEPTEMKVATGHKGKTAYGAVFRGEAGHSALAPNFQNALHLAADFMSDLRALQADLVAAGPFDPTYDIPYSTVHVGKLSGGTALNIVPERAEMLFEVRHLATQNMSQVQGQIAAAFASHAATDRQRSKDLEVINTYPGLEVDPHQNWVQDLAKWVGTGLTKVAFGTEAGLLSEMGVPSIVCGPGSMERQGHKADEFILRQQLDQCDAFLETVLSNMC